MASAIPSFRDPAGHCFSFQNRIFRFVAADALADFEAFFASPSAQKLVADGKLVASRRLADGELAELRSASPRSFSGGAGAFFEHEKIFFPSYPYEWPPEMLWAAGKLTLETARGALADGFGLKDATPANVLFRGSAPVFVDALSFERRDPHDPLWRPYAQFVRTFLLPLLANRRWGLSPADVFLTRRDGIEPEEIYRWCGPLEKFSPRLLSLVSIPTWLSRKANARADDGRIYRPRRLKNAEQARFILESLFRRLERTLDALRPPAATSAWSEYMGTHSYDDPAFAEKERFVREALVEFKPSRVLDAGANTGHFSAMAAGAGADVVAMDLDAACVGRMWRLGHEKSLKLLPLVLNLARPSPSLGWRNGESASFLDRAYGTFDGVLMLALIHHLLVTERIPLEEILRLAYELTNQLLIVEWVEPDDNMFRRLTRGREQLHESLNADVFESACRQYFDIVRSVALPGTSRRLYCCRRKKG